MGLLVLCTFDACMRSHLANSLWLFKVSARIASFFGFVGIRTHRRRLDDFAARSWDVIVPGKRKEEIGSGCTLIWCTAQCGRAQRAFHLRTSGFDLYCIIKAYGKEYTADLHWGLGSKVFGSVLDPVTIRALTNCDLESACKD